MQYNVDADGEASVLPLRTYLSQYYRVDVFGPTEEDVRIHSAFVHVAHDDLDCPVIMLVREDVLQNEAEGLVLEGMIQLLEYSS